MNGSLLILTFALQYASALQLTRRALPGAAAAATAIGTQNALAAAIKRGKPCLNAILCVSCNKALVAYGLVLFVHKYPDVKSVLIRKL